MGSRKLINLLIQFEKFYSAIPNSLWRNVDAPICAVRTWCYLYDRASDKSVIPWPSYKDIADVLQFTRRTAINAVNWLQENGYLVTEKSNDHPSNDYLLVCPALLRWCKDNNFLVKSIILGGVKDCTSTSEETCTLTIPNELNPNKTLPKPSETSASMVPSPAEETPKQRHKRWCKEIPVLISRYAGLYEKEVGVPPDLNGLGAKMAGLISQRLHHQSPAMLEQVLNTCFSTSDFTLSHARLSPLKIFSAEVFNRFQALEQEKVGSTAPPDTPIVEDSQPAPPTKLWDSINEEWYEPN